VFFRIISTLKRFLSSPKRPDSGSGTNSNPNSIYTDSLSSGSKAPERELTHLILKIRLGMCGAIGLPVPPQMFFWPLQNNLTFFLFLNVSVYSKNLGSHCELPRESLMNTDDCPHIHTFYSFALNYIFISVLGLWQMSQQLGSIVQWLLLDSELTDCLVRTLTPLKLLEL
jgi:hypothetical protein